MQPGELDLTRHSVWLESETDFAGWRDAARRLALNEVRPEDISWHVAAGSDRPLSDLPNVPQGAQLVVPRDFIGHAET
ncbi:uracil-DNA glycosylase, partial [Mesorhizobium sp. BR1-1-7]|nr:uracil-DNA glycosylase [Mesorhizobium sp. BR1-1-7]